MTEVPWLLRAREDLRRNTREVPGPGINPWIAQLYRDLRLVPPADDSTHAWCAVYANRTLMVCGVRPWRRLQLARGALDWGQPTEFRPGAIGVKRRLVDGKDDGVHGHVFFGVEIVGDHVMGLGGNQFNHVSIAPHPLSEMIGWRWPKPSDFLTGEVIP